MCTSKPKKQRGGFPFLFYIRIRCTQNRRKAGRGCLLPIRLLKKKELGWAVLNACCQMGERYISVGLAWAVFILPKKNRVLLWLLQQV
jgi:hypothetical protein